MKLVFMGSSGFAVPSLEALYRGGYKVALAVTQKDRPKGRGKKILPTPVKEKALELGIDVYQPDLINTKDSLDRLKAVSPDCIVVAAYGQILKKEILDLPKYKCLNVHASLLPKYRGAAPINWAIIEGEKETGITIIEMDEGLDTGDILKAERITIGITDDSLIVHDKLSQLGARLIVDTLRGIENGTIKKIPQDSFSATYATKLSKETGRIDWNANGDNIINLIRGLKPWPSAYMDYKGSRVKVHQGRKVKKFINGKKGEIIKVSNEGIFVNCLDSCIIIEILQFPGKRAMKVEDYLKGNQIDTSIRLG